jgi:tripartite-type tricarboxylate transporter receptor subunit TctC
MKQLKGACRNSVIVVVITLASLTVALTSSLPAEEFPSKPITAIVPWGPGGTTDSVTRMVAPVYEKALGQPVVVVNKPGGSAYIGCKTVSTSRPDGYTIGIMGGNVILLAETDPNITLDEFKWIGQIYQAPYAIAVNAESPWNTIDEFVDYARKHPMELKYGKSDTYGTQHVFSAGFFKAAGIKLAEVDYKAGFAATGLAVASKEVHLTCQSVLSLRPFIEGSKVRVLAMSGEKRSPSFPNIPTLKERGINYVYVSAEGFAAPKDTPDKTISILCNALEKTISDPSLAESFRKFDLFAEYKNNIAFEALMKQMRKTFHETLKEIGYVPSKK